MIDKYEPIPGVPQTERAWYRAKFTDESARYSKELRASFPWTRLQGVYPEYWTVAKACFMETFFRQGLLWGPWASLDIEVQLQPHNDESWRRVYYEAPAGEEESDEQES